MLKIDPLTNTPRSLMKLKGALTAPAAGSRDAIARSYLRGNASALGLSAADVDSLTLAERENAPGGLTLLRYRQAYKGIPTFDNGVRVAIDRGGRVLSLNGSPRHALSVASVTPRISATAALRALQRSVGLTRGVRVKSGPERRPAHDRLRERRAGPPHAVRRRRRPAAGLARRLQGDDARALRRRRRRDQRPPAVARQPRQELHGERLRLLPRRP